MSNQKFPQKIISIFAVSLVVLTVLVTGCIPAMAQPGFTDPGPPPPESDSWVEGTYTLKVEDQENGQPLSLKLKCSPELKKWYFHKKYAKKYKDLGYEINVPKESLNSRRGSSGPPVTRFIVYKEQSCSILNLEK